MKDLYKNPTLYYILVPSLIALWPLLIRAVYLPEAKRLWDDEKKEYNEAQQKIAGILELDGDRLDATGSGMEPKKFDYDKAINEVATSCRILPTNCQVKARPKRSARGQETQDCHVELKQIDITTFAQFLSTIQLRWANLECDSVTLSKRKGLPDKWDVDLDFKYYYSK